MAAKEIIYNESARGMILAAENYAWYAARAGGMLAFVLLTASVVAGLLLSGRVRLGRWPRFALEDVHGFLGLLAGSFILTGSSRGSSTV